MKLHCPKCTALVPAENIGVHQLVAKCSMCNEVFSYAALVTAAAPATAPLRVPIPPGLTIDDDGATKRITRRWYRPVVFIMAAFAIVWNGFLVAWFRVIGEATDNPLTLLFSLLPLAHVAVGIFLIYATVATFLNRTWVTVTEEKLTVRHGPLPWRGNKDLASAAIRQFYCDETMHRGKQSHSFTFNVQALMHDGSTITLLRGIQEKQLALFYEQQLEEWLKIPPQHVPGSIV